MVLISSGDFQMGSGGDRHKVYLDAYHIYRHEVTLDKYRDFSKTAGRKMPGQEKWSTDRHPVVNVDWDDAAAYCKWAGGRLPTEAEWEKAARGGTNTAYSFGDDTSKLGEYAWYNTNSNSKAHPVGQKKPNQYGLYDMHGNVWEWVSDWYDENYYARSPGKNPEGPASGTLRGIRGGSWYYDSYNLRAANHDKNTPGNRLNNLGFRCVVPAQDSK
ncbi:MAG: formylglycine-generating enzyme family protein [Elusimicrobiota bacterium]|nr:formylglycine-generating enzyme family protein [Elusimicrobiota bacterium]